MPMFILVHMKYVKYQTVAFVQLTFCTYIQTSQFHVIRNNIFYIQDC